MALVFSAMSQPGSGKRNNAVSIREITGFRLPASLDNLSLFDGMLHFVAGDMLVASPAGSVLLSSPVVDTTATAISPELTYSVRDPFTGLVYFTMNDSKGVSQLFVNYEKKPGKYATRRVKLPGYTSSIIHPVFTPDGRVMIFVSDSPLGFGGRDLWFAMRDGDEWRSPQNLGHFVNSGGDEEMPWIYGDYLIFSSNGRGDSYGGFDLYATRLVALKQGDTVMMYPIGRCPAYSLQAPFCTEDDDMAFVATDDQSQGWWMRRNAKGNEVLCRFDGSLECVEMQGIMTSLLYGELEGAYAVVAYTPRSGAAPVHDTVSVQPDGSYSFFLRTGVNYDLSFYAREHYVARQSIVASRPDEERLYALVSNDVVLKSIALDSLITYPNLFSSSVGSELTPYGRSKVDSLAQFMIENPGLRLNIYSTYNLSADIPFCSLLNGSRLRALTDYLVSKGVNAGAISTSTNIPRSLKRMKPSKNEGRSVSPVAQSSLTVGFSFSKK